MISQLKKVRSQGDFDLAKKERRKEMAEVVLSAKNFLSTTFSDARIAVAGARMIDKDSGRMDLSNLRTVVPKLKGDLEKSIRQVHDS